MALLRLWSHYRGRHFEIQEQSDWTGEREVGILIKLSSNPPTELQHLSHPVVLDCRLLNTEWSNPSLLVTFPPTARSQRSSHISRSDEREQGVSLFHCFTDSFTLFRLSIVDVFKAISCWNFLSTDCQYLKNLTNKNTSLSFSSPIHQLTHLHHHFLTLTCIYRNHLIWLSHCQSRVLPLSASSYLVIVFILAVAMWEKVIPGSLSFTSYDKTILTDPHTPLIVSSCGWIIWCSHVGENVENIQ